MADKQQPAWRVEQERQLLAVALQGMANTPEEDMDTEQFQELARDAARAVNALLQQGFKPW